jgi:hypothetical protein
MSVTTINLEYKGKPRKIHYAHEGQIEMLLRGMVDIIWAKEQPMPENHTQGCSRFCELLPYPEDAERQSEINWQQAKAMIKSDDARINKIIGA